ncbi:MAG: hypothetical protein ACHQT9_03135 [Candidatus Saccharimonadales bacterium]
MSEPLLSQMGEHERPRVIPEELVRLPLRLIEGAGHPDMPVFETPDGHRIQRGGSMATEGIDGLVADEYDHTTGVHYLVKPFDSHYPAMTEETTLPNGMVTRHRLNP